MSSNGAISHLNNASNQGQHGQTSSLSNPYRDQQISFLHNARQLASYNMNDLVNLTCLSGISRPTAQLTWYLNDQPIQGSNQLNPKWFSIHEQRPQNISQSSKDSTSMIEGRSTLTFRLDSNMINLFAKNSTGLHPQMLIKLRCLSKLSTAFVSETSMTISGSPRLVKNRHSPSSARIYSKIGENEASALSDSNSGLPSSADDYPIYRWPAPNPIHHARGPARKDQSEWIELQQQPHGTEVSSRKHQQHWTTKQLKAQSEHVERIMEKFRPNEIDTPIIEAKSTEIDSRIDVELIEVSCRPRGQAFEREPSSAVSRWYINGHEVSK